ncbi:hypothetical protein FB451DRAFT_1218202, partial [Mycena latifolia]
SSHESLLLVLPFGRFLSLSEAAMDVFLRPHHVLSSVFHLPKLDFQGYLLSTRGDVRIRRRSRIEHQKASTCVPNEIQCNCM